MTNVTEKHFEKLLSPIFPENADFLDTPTMEGLQFSVSWKLNNNPTRPNIRCRRILLMISQETLEDFEDGRQNDKIPINKKFVHLVKERLKHFTPEHNTPYGQPDPEEKWYL